MKSGDLDLFPHEEELSGVGKKGLTTVFSVRSYCLFQVHALEATDNQGGGVTEVVELFVGATPILGFYDDKEPRKQCVFSRDFVLKQILAVEPLLDVSISVRFLEGAAWTGRLIGRAIKRESDTRAILRERAVRAYEAEILSRSPSVATDKRFKEMIASMLRHP